MSLELLIIRSEELRAEVFSASGELVSTIAQEGMVRMPTASHREEGRFLLAYTLLNKLRRLALNFLLSLTSTDYILSIVYLNTLGETTSNTNRLYCTPLTRDSR